MRAEQYRKILCTKEAAQYVGLSKSTLDKFRVYGGGPRYSKLGHAVRYSTIDLDDWLAEARRSSTSVAA